MQRVAVILFGTLEGLREELVCLRKPRKGFQINGNIVMKLDVICCISVNVILCKIMQHFW